MSHFEMPSNFDRYALAVIGVGLIALIVWRLA
jgi:hypothetical protein